jgi:hypothetical protein
MKRPLPNSLRLLLLLFCFRILFIPYSMVSLFYPLMQDGSIELARNNMPLLFYIWVLEMYLNIFIISACSVLAYALIRRLPEFLKYAKIYFAAHAIFLVLDLIVTIKCIHYYSLDLKLFVFSTWTNVLLGIIFNILLFMYLTFSQKIKKYFSSLGKGTK